MQPKCSQSLSVHPQGAQLRVPGKEGEWGRLNQGCRGRGKRCRLTGVASDQGEQEGVPFTSELTQPPPSFSPGNGLSPKRKEAIN